jgi:hypothetical protein
MVQLWHVDWLSDIILYRYTVVYKIGGTSLSFSVNLTKSLLKIPWYLKIRFCSVSASINSVCLCCYHIKPNKARNIEFKPSSSTIQASKPQHFYQVAIPLPRCSTPWSTNRSLPGGRNLLWMVVGSSIKKLSNWFQNWVLPQCHQKLSALSFSIITVLGKVMCCFYKIWYWPWYTTFGIIVRCTLQLSLWMYFCEIQQSKAWTLKNSRQFNWKYWIMTRFGLRLHFVVLFCNAIVSCFVSHSKLRHVSTCVGHHGHWDWYCTATEASCYEHWKHQLVLNVVPIWRIRFR